MTRDNNLYEEMVQKLEEDNHKERKLRTKIEDILAKASIAIKDVLIVSFVIYLSIINNKKTQKV